MLNEKRADYIKFWEAFGLQIKAGIYTSYGMNKDKLQDLLMFYSSKEDKLVTLKEYIDNNKEEKNIYYACGEDIDKLKLLPQVEALVAKDKDILLCTNYLDEFVFKIMGKFEEKEFKNVCSDNIDIDTESEKEELNKLNTDSKDLLELMKQELHISDVKFTSRLNNHPVCLSTIGEISVEMEKALNAIPSQEEINAQKVLEINAHHPIAQKLQELYKNDKEALKQYSKVLYAQARLIEGLSIDNPSEISNIICDILVKK